MRRILIEICYSKKDDLITKMTLEKYTNTVDALVLHSMYYNTYDERASTRLE